MEQALDTFRPATIGWLIGTLAGWGTILLGLIGIVAALIGYGMWPLALVLVALLILALEVARQSCGELRIHPTNG